MGRDLCESTRGWCFRETVSGHQSRVSTFFRTKDDALNLLRENDYPTQLIDMLEEMEHVPSMMMGPYGMFACGLEIDRILKATGKNSQLRSQRISDAMTTLFTASLDDGLEPDNQTDEVKEAIAYMTEEISSRTEEIVETGLYPKTEKLLQSLKNSNEEE